MSSPDRPTAPPGGDPSRSGPSLSRTPFREIDRREVLRLGRDARPELRADVLTGEAPLEIRAAGPGQAPVAVAVTMRTPGHEDELAAGFLHTEGLIGGGSDIGGFERPDAAAAAQPDDTILVRLTRPFDPSVVAERHFVATASCGICGKASIDEVAVRCDPIPLGRPVMALGALLALPERMRRAQAVFEVTGGLHAAALFTPDGDLVTLREDVGRHNALDKVIGSQLLAGALPLNDRVVLVSGRVSFELVQKAAVAGAPILCAVSAPSDLAVEAAERLGVTIVGFLRGDACNVYSHPERIEAER